MLAYAYKDEGGIDLDTIGSSSEVVKDRLLRECLGWRYDYLKDRERMWTRLQKYGKIIEVEITER